MIPALPPALRTAGRGETRHRPACQPCQLRRSSAARSTS